MRKGGAKLQALFSRLLLIQGVLTLLYALWSTWRYDQAHPIVWSCAGMLFLLSGLLAAEARNSGKEPASDGTPR